MAKIDELNIKGKKVETIELSDAVFGIVPNQQAIYDAVLLQRASLRQGTHKVKGRSEVRGGGAKPWRQKGTGRARQGTIRAPQWRGGGVVFGPTPRSYNLKMNRKVRKLAIKSAIASKFLKGEIIVIEDFNLKAPKTKEMVTVLSALKADRKPLLITSEYDENVFLSSRNIPGLINLDATGINVLDVVGAHSVIITKSAVAKIEEVLG
jgi:large subunit ribosomal protein L4